jgi:hypothetical protein
MVRSRHGDTVSRSPGHRAATRSAVVLLIRVLRRWLDAQQLHSAAVHLGDPCAPPAQVEPVAHGRHRTDGAHGQPAERLVLRRDRGCRRTTCSKSCASVAARRRGGSVRAVFKTLPGEEGLAEGDAYLHLIGGPVRAMEKRLADDRRRQLGITACSLGPDGRRRPHPRTNVHTIDAAAPVAEVLSAARRLSAARLPEPVSRRVAGASAAWPVQGRTCVFWDV